jgi:hypothetical protein
MELDSSRALSQYIKQNHMPVMADQSLVSWQSAFWGLAPLALNSMLQPTRPKARYSGIESLALRASPIVCAVDALTSLLQILYLTRFRGPSQNLTVRHAAKVWLLARNESTSGQKEPVEASKRVRLFVFILGTLSQSTKLFACQGIPWTQTWAYLYVTSFAVFTILECLATTTKETGSDDLSMERKVPHLKRSQIWDFSQFCFQAALWLHAAFMTWALAVAIPPLVHIKDYSSMPRWLAILSVPAQLLYVVMFWPITTVMFIADLGSMLIGHGSRYMEVETNLFVNNISGFLTLCWQCFFFALFFYVVLLVLAFLSVSLSPRYALARRVEMGVHSLANGFGPGDDTEVILQSTPIVRTSPAKEKEKLFAFWFIFCTFGAALA